MCPEWAPLAQDARESEHLEVVSLRPAHAPHFDGEPEPLPFR